MVLESDEESCAFSLAVDGVEVGHIFTEDGKTWGAFLGDPTATEEVGRFRTRGGAKRRLLARARKRVEIEIQDAIV